MSVEMLSSPISEPAPAQPRAAKGDEIDLGAIVAAIKRRRGTILGLAVLCTSIGIGAKKASICACRSDGLGGATGSGSG